MRYYICNTIGDGTPSSPYRPELADFFAANEVFDWSSFPEVLSDVETGRHAVTFISPTDQTTLDEILGLLKFSVVVTDDTSTVFGGA